MAKIITLPTRLDTNSVSDVENIVLKALNENRFLIINFVECRYISSIGIRLLLMSKKELIKKDGDIFITHVSADIKKILDMTGMTQMLNPCDSLEEAIEETNSRESNILNIELMSGLFYHSLHDSCSYLLRDKICGCNGFGIAFGEGTFYDCEKYSELMSGLSENSLQVTQLFVATKHFAAISPDNDFRCSNNPKELLLSIKEGVVYNQPSGYCDIDDNNVNGCVLDDIISIAEGKGGIKNIAIIAVVCDELKCIKFLDIYKKKGVCICLDKLDINKSNFINMLENNLKLVNINEVRYISKDTYNDNGSRYSIFIFRNEFGKECADSQELNIEIIRGELLSKERKYIVSELYSDSSKIEIKELTGGFSTKTYQVSSFDKNGRKMRPTVLKIADADIIGREAQRCMEYAEPYIFNNSAKILGTSFIGTKGGLRYNFVGVGGESSKLQWLTKHYLERDFYDISPLFDRIFKEILSPWYGQGRKGVLKLFSDHNPMLTFFANIPQNAKELLNISADDEYIDDYKRLINPYYLLKHIYPLHIDDKREYYLSICHGDLNMQNILIDEKENIYLIDFSETKLRNIVSDFARLEDIFIFEFSDLQTEAELLEFISIVSPLYKAKSFDEEIFINYKGKSINLKSSVQEEFSQMPLFLRNGLRATAKMREYAYCYSKDKDIVPYYFALLEWSLPIVSYGSVKSLYTKRASMIVSSMIFETLNGIIDFYRC
jgi:anti-anti-sigma factor